MTGSTLCCILHRMDINTHSELGRILDTTICVLSLTRLIRRIRVPISDCLCVKLSSQVICPNMNQYHIHTFGEKNSCMVLVRCPHHLRRPHQIICANKTVSPIIVNFGDQLVSYNHIVYIVII